MAQISRELTIGQMAQRTGLAVSAIRYYADQGLIQAERNRGGHRRFARAQVRRVSFILIAQQFGLSLPQIKAILEGLPEGRTPNAADWAEISVQLRAHLEAHIVRLEQMRDSLDGCIGCGCLSLDACRLYNPDDALAMTGTGPLIAMSARS